MTARHGVVTSGFGDAVVTLRLWFAVPLAWAAGCNALLDNEEGTLIDGSGGSVSTGGSTSSGGANAGGVPAGEGGSDSPGEGGTATGPSGAGGDTEQSPAAGSPSTEPSGGASNPEPGPSGGTGTGGSADESEAGSPGSAGEAGAGSPGCISNECTPTTVQMVEVSCGPCGKGRQLAPRACRSDCTWGEPAAPTGTCDTTGLCDPAAAPQMRTAPCPNGGWKNQELACTSECTLGTWTDTEACQQGPNGCDGCACVSYCEHPERHVTTCLWIACTQAEAQAECEEDIVARSCMRRPPVELIDWRP